MDSAVCKAPTLISLENLRRMQSSVSFSRAVANGCRGVPRRQMKLWHGEITSRLLNMPHGSVLCFFHSSSYTDVFSRSCLPHKMFIVLSTFVRPRAVFFEDKNMLLGEIPRT